ncbi:MAG: class B sortase [Clostridia bacterium]|nr:class B sortase [Clostridia bacterium]
MSRSHTKDNKVLRRILFLIRIICVIVIIVCLIYIIQWYMENKKNAAMLSHLTDSSVKDTITIQLPSENEDGNQEEKPVEIQVYELDFDKLFSVNDHTVGWITVPGTSINYPVAQASDNSFYLKHSFDKSKNTAGWIFADYRNKFDGTDKNIIIYGHNRVDSSMFATLKNTQKANWYNNANNKYISFITPSGTQVYEVFSVYTIKMESYYLQTDFSTDQDYLTFLNTLKSRSVHDFGTKLSTNDKIITLSTCDATGKSRVILHAKKIM